VPNPLSLPETIPLLGWRWDDLLFLLFSAVVLGAGLMVVLGRNIIRSGLWMILSFAALAGIYVLLGATFVAAAQVLVYIGAISVLVLFAIMLTQSKEGPSALIFHHQAWAAAIASVGLAVILSVAVAATPWPGVGEKGATLTVALAQLLFDPNSGYILPFEIVSVLLLAAVIGGVFLAKREDSELPQTAAQRLMGSGPGGPSGRSSSGIGSAWSDAPGGDLDRLPGGIPRGGLTGGGTASSAAPRAEDR
jgi:NADH:ubiquinone oxidoreductase subunit 6 (subunit J)